VTGKASLSVFAVYFLDLLRQVGNFRNFLLAAFYEHVLIVFTPLFGLTIHFTWLARLFLPRELYILVFRDKFMDFISLHSS
jgi:hypothetical protein